MGKKKSESLPQQEEELYRVEKLVDARKWEGKNYYLVKWDGYPSSDNTWEPEVNVLVDDDNSNAGLCADAMKASVLRGTAERPPGPGYPPMAKKYETWLKKQPKEIKEELLAPPSAPSKGKKRSSSSGEKESTSADPEPHTKNTKLSLPEEEEEEEETTRALCALLSALSALDSGTGVGAASISASCPFFDEFWKDDGKEEEEDGDWSWSSFCCCTFSSSST
mmetsp:Transcript_13736/g.27310  ORF Transcript_13736/g.27310 Transcript_13736/m.27310 type:complete len:222 (+) Transcript_13736:206-871(+)